MSLLTLFTIPRSFDDQWTVIQKNAIDSWQQLGPSVEIILIGDDEGIAEFASGAGVKHCAGVESSEFGTPLLSSAFKLAAENSTSPLLGYVNCDIVLLPEFVVAIDRVVQHFSGSTDSDFLAIGRRTNLFIDAAVDFQQPSEVEQLRSRARKSGQLDSVVCKDYFVFPRTRFTSIPDFAVGRGNWDNWMLAKAKSDSLPVVSLTECAMVIHQTNMVTHSGLAKFKNYVSGPEAKSNQHLAGGRNLIEGSTSTHRLTNSGVVYNRWYRLGCEFWFDFPRFARLMAGFVGK